MDLANLIISNIVKLKKFDVQTLSRRDELGANYNFDQAIPIATKIVLYANEFDEKIVNDFPSQDKIKIENTFKEVLKNFEEILNYDNSTTNSSHVRKTLLDQTNIQLNKIFDLIKEYKSMMLNTANDLAALKSTTENLNSIELKARKTEEKLVSMYKSISETDKNEHADHIERVANINISIDKINERIALSKKDANKMNVELLNNLKKGVSTAKVEIYEALKLEETRTLWDDKRKAHSQSYGWLAALLVVILIGIPILAIWNIDSLVSKLQEITFLLTPTINEGSGGQAPSSNFNWVLALSNQITRLLIVGLPIMAYVWITRIIVRIFLANRALMDDAYERKVMLDTYLFLVGEGKANENDRPLILNALFRPSPGQSPDIEPPSLSDVITLKNRTKNNE